MTDRTTSAIIECAHPVPTDRCIHTVKGKRCGERAAFIIWGKLHEPHELGPKCLDHVPLNLNIAATTIHAVMGLGSYAAFDLRPYWGSQIGSPSAGDVS